MGAKISIFSYPKVNLALDILRRDKSGYHEIQTIFHELKGPADEITMESFDEDKIEINCNNSKVPLNMKNTVLKAAVFLRKYLKSRGKPQSGTKIFIKKRIPLMSGLGGGASNAVAALKGLAELWGVKCCDSSGQKAVHDVAQNIAQKKHPSNCILRRIADQIGMDCAFFFDGGTALGEHFGEKISPLPPLPPRIKFEVIETGVEISSHWAYQYADLKLCGRQIGKTQKLIAALKNGDTKTVLENIHNDFEKFVFKKYPQLLEIKQKIEAKKPGRVLLCGSGGCFVRIHF